MIQKKALVLLFLTLFLVQACASRKQRTVTPYRKKPEAQQTTKLTHQQRKTGRSVTVPQNHVVKRISKQANAHIWNGDLEAAAQILERGLRIAPKDAELWSQLATVRLKQQRYGQAKSLAAKSNSFAGGNTKLVDKNRAIIEGIRK